LEDEGVWRGVLQEGVALLEGKKQGENILQPGGMTGKKKTGRGGEMRGDRGDKAILRRSEQENRRAQKRYGKGKTRFKKSRDRARVGKKSRRKSRGSVNGVWG